MRHRRTFWILFVLLALLAAVVPMMVVYWRHTVPLSQCSEVYQRFRHQPGVRAAFIKDMPISDTLRLDMTLLEAEDSAAFADLLREMGENEEFIRDMAILREIHIKEENGENVRYTGDWKWNEGGFQEISHFPVRRCIAIFHCKTEEEANVVFHRNIHNDFDIEQH